MVEAIPRTYEKTGEKEVGYPRDAKLTYNIYAQLGVYIDAIKLLFDMKKMIKYLLIDLKIRVH